MPTFWIDHGRGEALTLTECLRLLALGAGQVARVGRVEGPDQVVMEPVVYHMYDEDVLVKVYGGFMLEAASENDMVFFEVDDASPAQGHAWSIVVQGVAAPHRNRAQAVPAPGDASGAGPAEGSYVRIRAGLLSGRRYPLRLLA